MTLTVARLLRFVFAALGLAMMLSLVTYYWLFTSAKKNADLLDTVTELRWRASRVHWVVNRGRMEQRDFEYIRRTGPAISEVLQALERGGVAFGRVIPPLHPELTSELTTMKRQWMALSPGLAELARMDSPEGTYAIPDTRVHPAMPDFEAQVIAIQGRLQGRRDAIRRRTFEVLLLTSALVMFVLLGSALLINRWIVKPVRVLIDGTHAIRRGDFQHRVPTTTMNELGVLGASFNEMAEAVQQSVDQLSLSVAQLESEVEQRRRVESRLLQSEARLAEAQRVAHVGNWEVDLESETLYWSDEVYRIYGTEPTGSTLRRGAPG